MGVPATYTGCATFFSLLESSAAKLLSSSIADIALLFRNGISCLKQGFVAEVLAFADQNPSAQLAFPDTFISNWDSFGPLAHYDFGISNGGAPAAIRLPPVGFNGLGYVLPSEDGIDVMLGLVATDLERFKVDSELAEAGGIILGEM